LLHLFWTGCKVGRNEYAYTGLQLVEINLMYIYMICRLIAKYRPSMPVLSVVIPLVKTNQLKWSLTGAFEVRELQYSL
jgi:hypothetical protein